MYSWSMDENLKGYIKQQYFANVLIGLGLITMFSGVSFLGLAGSIFAFTGIGILIFQRIYRKDLFNRDKALKKSIRNERITVKANMSKSEKELKRIRFILTCMSTAIGLFFLAMALSYFG